MILVRKSDSPPRSFECSHVDDGFLPNRLAPGGTLLSLIGRKLNEIKKRRQGKAQQSVAAALDQGASSYPADWDEVETRTLNQQPRYTQASTDAGTPPSLEWVEQNARCEGWK